MASKDNQTSNENPGTGGDFNLPPTPPESNSGKSSVIDETVADSSAVRRSMRSRPRKGGNAKEGKQGKEPLPESKAVKRASTDKKINSALKRAKTESVVSVDKKPNDNQSSEDESSLKDEADESLEDEKDEEDVSSKDEKDEEDVSSKDEDEGDEAAGEDEDEAAGEEGDESSGDDSSLEDGEYVVESIEDYWVDNGKDVYLIKWYGWSVEHNTWEEKNNLNCTEKLTTFFLKRVEEIKLCKTVNTGHPRRLNSTLKRLPCPPDPRQLEERIEYFFTEVMKSMPTDEELLKVLKANNSGRKTTSWPQTKVDRFLLDATLGNLKEESKTALAEYLLVEYAKLRHEKCQRLLKEWELELNTITQGLPKITVVNEVNFTGPPTDFRYVNDYVSGPDVFIPTDPLLGCECESSCLANKKSCCPINHEGIFAYFGNKRVAVKPGTPIFECNSRCQCDATCANRVVQDGTVSLRGSRMCIYMTTNKGWGVRTLKSIKKGTFVALYAGEVICTAEANVRGKDYDRDGLTYLFDLDLNETEEEECMYCVDAKHMGNISHFFNHSCDPNLTVYNVFVDCIDVNLPKLALFARRDIAKDEELTFDYLNKEKDDKGGGGTEKPQYQCLCGASNCRKFLF